VPNKWLTPNISAIALQCRAIVFPYGEDWLALVAGALLELTRSYNFEAYGTATPEDTADAFGVMFDAFSFNTASCRMIGEIIPYAGATSPDVARLLFCTGSSLLRSDYPDLFAVVGTAYGSVDGAHFNLPDLRGRAPVASGTGLGLTSHALGDSFGEENHTLVTAEMPSHSHTDTGHSHTTGNSILLGTSVPPPLDALGPNPLPAFTGSASANLTNTGGDGAHNNIPPELAINFLIVALP